MLAALLPGRSEDRAKAHWYGDLRNSPMTKPSSNLDSSLRHLALGKRQRAHLAEAKTREVKTRVIDSAKERAATAKERAAVAAMELIDPSKEMGAMAADDVLSFLALELTWQLRWPPPRCPQADSCGRPRAMSLSAGATQTRQRKPCLITRPLTYGCTQTTRRVPEFAPLLDRSTPNFRSRKKIESATKKKHGS